MASLTVRQIDEALKQQLRLRAARHGRSVEDEVRTILREAAGDTETPAAPAAGPLPATAADAPQRVLLIIGGGIAAYKSLDLIRRLRERGQRFEHRQREADARGFPETAAVEGHGGFSGDAHKK